MQNITQSSEKSNPESNGFWQSALSVLKRQTTAAIFDSLIKPLHVEKTADGVLYLSTAGNGIRALETQWKRQILAALPEDLGITDVVFEKAEPNADSGKGQMEAAPLPSDDEGFEVRDHRQAEWFYIDNYFIDGGYAAHLGPYGFAVYGVLAKHADTRDQIAWPSHATIARVTGMSRAQVKNKVREMKALNIIKTKHQYKEDGTYSSNAVMLVNRAKWKKLEG